MIKSSLEARAAELDVDVLARCKDVGHVVDFLRGFDVVDGYATVSFDEFDIPDDAVLGG
jgi:hypothetical protein